MRSDRKFTSVTVEDFLAIDFPSDTKYELIDGVIEMMAGGTRAHARVATNIASFLRNALRGTGYMPYNSDAGLKIDAINLRYPDVAVYCNDPATPETDTLLMFDQPRVIFEVLSPGTERHDKRAKMDEYRTLASLDTVVLVDPVRELTRVVQRLGPTSWRDDLFAQPHDVVLPSLKVVIPHAEIFARN